MSQSVSTKQLSQRGLSLQPYLSICLALLLALAYSTFSSASQSTLVPATGTESVSKHDRTNTTTVVSSGAGVQIVAQLQGRANSIAVDSTGVYIGLHGGDLMRLTHDGSETSSIYPGIIGARHTDIAVDETHVYWNDYRGVWRGAKEGGAVELLVGEPTSRLRILEGTLFWALAKGGDLYRAPTEGGPKTLIAKGQGKTIDFVISRNAIYWSTNAGMTISPRMNALYRLSFEKDHPLLLAGNQANAIRIAIDGQSVYWRTLAQPGEGKILGIPEQGGEPQVLASGQDAPNALAVAGNHIYWLNYGENAGSGSLHRIEKTEGETETLAIGLGRPGREIIVYGGFIYWIEPPDGRVSRYQLPR